jgi:hypothetical protein
MCNNVYLIQSAIRLCDSIGTLEQRASVSFEQCGVSDVNILDNLAGMGIEQPTHVQVYILYYMLLLLYCIEIHVQLHHVVYLMPCCV